MNDIMKDMTGIAMAIIGVAILYTLVNPDNKTAQVLGAATQGFGNVLGVAIGNNKSFSNNVMGGY